jgi:phage terminase large subunit GpA-like protein
MQNIYPIKGRAGKQLIFDARSKTWKKKKYGKFYNVGVDTAKTRHFSFMNVEEEGPGFMHFCEGLSQDYFEGLASESRVETKSRGKTKIKWVIKSGVRNEPLDARIYAMAARFSFGNADIGARAESISNKQGEKREIKKEEKKAEEQEEQETSKQTSARKHQEYIQRIQALRNQRPQGWISGRGKKGFG